MYNVITQYGMICSFLGDSLIKKNTNASNFQNQNQNNFTGKIVLQYLIVAFI